MEIASSLSYAKFDDIKDSKYALEIWKSLSNIYGGDENVQRGKRESLKEKFNEMRMEEGESITQYASRIKEVVSSIRSKNGTLDDETINSKVLRTLHPIYAIRVSAIQ